MHSRIGQADVLAALAEVYDPELDEPITALGFIGSCVVSPDGDVDLALRLPTPQCAPNFAFLMAADARKALVALPQVGEVSVVLTDHYTGAEINTALEHGGDFEAAFPGESGAAPADLEALRELFRRKALLARQGRVARALLDAGAGAGEITALTLGDLSAQRTPEVDRCITLRRELGLPYTEQSPALVAGDGTALSADGLRLWLRRARLVGLSLESNGGICRSLLRVRHGVPDPTQEELVA